MIPEKIANAWVTGEMTGTETLFGYRNGAITISIQKNAKADRQTEYKACLRALNEYFKIKEHDTGI